MSNKNGTVELCRASKRWFSEDTFRRLVVQTGFWSDLLFNNFLNSLWSLALHTPNNILCMEASKNCQVFVGWILKINKEKCPLCLGFMYTYLLFQPSPVFWMATLCVFLLKSQAILTLAPFGVLLRLGSWKSFRLSKNAPGFRKGR